MLDIRTISVLTIVYNLILGIIMLIYSFKKEGSKGIKNVGLGLIFAGTGFLFIAYRDFISEFFTVIVSNTLIIMGVMSIFHGLSYFITHKKRNKAFEWVALLLMIALFIQFTYFQPNINMRVVIISIYQIVYFYRIAHLLIFKVPKLLERIGLVLSLVFLLAILVSMVRIYSTLIEQPIDNLMSAGSIHALAIILYQLLPFNLSLGMFWISITVYEEKLEVQAMTDYLTTLYNRAAILKLGEAELKRARRHAYPVGVVMCDIDHFKRINDTYGHDAGDVTLKTVSDIIRSNIRLSDMVGRFGGEEFLLIIPDITQLNLLQLVNKIRLLIEEHTIQYDKHEIKVTLSFGVDLIGPDSYHLTDAIKSADEALYMAKANGRNRVEFN
ncbi:MULTISPECIES: GGDEF domain-containing protein [unclassified Fusibacter]|uniref:GGDEF domain-containing protein n=1 Tax=unclassified Fusibacter TaxID=2624464 RepID=UPI001012CFEF|nr:MULTISPECIES: GGDEF domain-containing protein [unclassified Fusibacter]MCK8060043.1 GGDEF domain-containing protein [Fusibacter sp. A2]NPE22185.1 GGDEF domain-containing protein [Fusibacter sp. A1]RXV60961.1 GGDEF domain-containing protein [Fusibacter sp. A1]